MDEQLKQRVLFAVVGFNFTVLLYQFVVHAIYGTDSWTTLFIRLGVSAVLGLAVAAGAFFGSQMMQK